MPLAGHDGTERMAARPFVDISTPMPLAGHDKVRMTSYRIPQKFLLPCPSRGMTMRQVAV